MSVRSFALALVAVAACQSGSGGSAAPPSKEAPKAKEAGSSGAEAGSGWKATAYGRDIERLCNAEKYSGALDQPPEARQIMVAQWLGPNLETPEAHDFLVKLQPLGAADKYAALDGESHKVGLDDCPLALAWKPAPKP